MRPSPSLEWHCRCSGSFTQIEGIFAGVIIDQTCLTDRSDFRFAEDAGQEEERPRFTDEDPSAS